MSLHRETDEVNHSTRQFSDLDERAALKWSCRSLIIMMIPGTMPHRRNLQLCVDSNVSQRVKYRFYHTDSN